MGKSSATTVQVNLNRSYYRWR